MRCVVQVLVGSCLLLGVPSSPSQAQDWSGAYAGIHAGHRWADLDLSTPPYTFSDGTGGTVYIPARNEQFSLRGAMGGFHAGYNTFLTPQFLIGIEADITAANDQRSSSAAFSTSHTETSFQTITTITPGDPCDEGCECECESPPPVVTTTRVPVQTTVVTNQQRNSSVELVWQGTVRTRFGWVAGNWLYYGTAGIAFTGFSWSETLSVADGASQTVSKNGVLTGVVFGGGVETWIGENLLFRVEYLHEDFGSTTVPLAFTAKTGEIDVDVDKVRVGLSLAF